MYTQFFEKHEKSESREKNILLLSGSRAAGNLPIGAERPEFLSFAKEWVREIFSDAISYGKPVLFVPYARLGRKTEEEYFEFIKQNTAGLGLKLTMRAIDRHNKRISAKHWWHLCRWWSYLYPAGQITKNGIFGTHSTKGGERNALLRIQCRYDYLLPYY